MSKSTRLLVILGLVALVTPVAFLLIRAVVFNCQEQLDGLLFNFATELAGAVVTYILFEIIIGRRMQQEADKRAIEMEGARLARAAEAEKKRLIRQMGSTVPDRALAAAEEVAQQGWLYDGSLEGEEFGKAKLEGADLNEADLVGVDLRGAVLSSCNLTKADLRGAILWNAILKKATLRETILEDTQLDGVDLSSAGELTDEQLSKAFSLLGATMPNGTRYNGRFNLEGDLVTAHHFMKVGTSDEAMAGFYDVTVEAYQWGQKWNKWSKSSPVPPIPHEEKMSPEYKQWLEINKNPDWDGNPSVLIGWC